MHLNKFNNNNEEFSENEFAESIIPLFCLTVYKYQGGEINTDYSRIDQKQLYTALSRTTKFEYIKLFY